MDTSNHRLLYIILLICAVIIICYFFGIKYIHDNRYKIHYILAILWTILLCITTVVYKLKKEKKNKDTRKLLLLVDGAAIYFILFHLIYSFHILHGSMKLF